MPKRARSPMMSRILCRTNSSEKRRPVSFSMPCLVSTIALSSDPPRIRFARRSASTSSIKPKVRAEAMSRAKEPLSSVTERCCTPISGCGKSIRQSISNASAGSIEMLRLPEATPTLSRTSNARRAAGCSTTLALSIISANDSAEPSIIGTSRLSTSM